MADSPHNIQEDHDERVAARETAVVPSGAGRGDGDLRAPGAVATPHSELAETIRVGLGLFRNVENGCVAAANDALSDLVEQLESMRETLRWFASERGFVTDEQDARVRAALGSNPAKRPT